MDSNEARLRAAIHYVLAAGIWSSSLLMAAGLLLYPWQRTLGGLSMRAGILLLMITPVFRVAGLAMGYGRARDWPFFGAASGVLGLLAAGIFLGLR